MSKPIDKSNLELIELELVKTFDGCNEPLKEMLSLLERVQNSGTEMKDELHPDVAKSLDNLVRTVKQIDVMINQK